MGRAYKNDSSLKQETFHSLVDLPGGVQPGRVDRQGAGFAEGLLLHLNLTLARQTDVSALTYSKVEHNETCNHNKHPDRYAMDCKLILLLVCLKRVK